jgi:predicted dehydrogenase
VAAADVFEDRMESSLARLKESFPERCDVPKERRFLGFDAYKKVLESDVDVVLLTTPPGFRPMQFEAAVEAGKHVFMEKPVAVDAPGVRRILAAGRRAREKGLSVAVGFDFRHEPNHKECVKMIQDGVLGEIHHMRALYNNAGVWVRPRQSGQTEMQYQVRNWYYHWLSGDHIVEQHVYTWRPSTGSRGGAHPVRAIGWAADRSGSAKTTARSSIIISTSSSTPTAPSCSASAARFPAAGTAAIRRMRTGPRATPSWPTNGTAPST